MFSALMIYSIGAWTSCVYIGQTDGQTNKKQSTAKHNTKNSIEITLK